MTQRGSAQLLHRFTKGAVWLRARCLELSIKHPMLPLQSGRDCLRKSVSVVAIAVQVSHLICQPRWPVELRCEARLHGSWYMMLSVVELRTVDACTDAVQ